MQEIYVVLAAVIIMLASLSGVFFIGKRPTVWLKKNLKYLTTLSAGVFIAITYHLIQEVIHESSALWFSILGWIAVGILVVEILSHLIPKAHHHHGEEENGHAHTALDARRMLLGDALHNISDGLLLVPAFLIDTHVGIFTAFAIFAHELVQEISEFFVLKEAGYTNRQAFGRNFLVATTILIGVFISLIAISVEALEIPLLCFAAGGFIYIILRDLIPHAVFSVREEKGSATKHVAIGLVGIALMLLVNTFVSHEHPEEEPHEDEGSEIAEN